MGTDSHRAHIERYFASIDANETEEMLRLFHPDIIYEREGQPPIVGMDALKEFYDGVRLIKSGTHQIEVLLVEGDWACAKGRFVGTLRDGSSVSSEFADLHRFRDNLIWRRHTYFAGQPI